MKYGLINLGQIEALINRIGGEDGLQAILDGRAEVVVKEHFIDLDAPPLIPYDGWKVESHQKGGKWKWDPQRVRLTQSAKQESGGTIPGTNWDKELAAHLPFNANFMDYLLDRPQLIPDDWKLDAQGRTRYIYCWGTKYRDSDGSLYVRDFCFDDGDWQSCYDCVESAFGARGWSVVPASGA